MLWRRLAEGRSGARRAPRVGGRGAPDPRPRRAGLGAPTVAVASRPSTPRRASAISSAAGPVRAGRTVVPGRGTVLPATVSMGSHTLPSANRKSGGGWRETARRNLSDQEGGGVADSAAPVAQVLRSGREHSFRRWFVRVFVSRGQWRWDSTYDRDFVAAISCFYKTAPPKKKKLF